MHLVAVDAALIFQALADPTRIRIVRVLAATDEEACLCELVDSLHEPQYKLSRHLKILRQAGILATEKEGRFIYHRLVVRPPYLAKLHSALRSLPDRNGQFSSDLRRFRERMRLRDAGRCRIGIQTSSLAVAVKGRGVA